MNHLSLISYSGMYIVVYIVVKGTALLDHPILRSAVPCRYGLVEDQPIIYLRILAFGLFVPKWFSVRHGTPTYLHIWKELVTS